MTMKPQEGIAFSSQGQESSLRMLIPELLSHVSKAAAMVGMDSLESINYSPD